VTARGLAALATFAVLLVGGLVAMADGRVVAFWCGLVSVITSGAVVGSALTIAIQKERR
jgi:hypothetical protein